MIRDGRLIILDNFIVDHRLKKDKVKPKIQDSEDGENPSDFGFSIDGLSDSSTPSFYRSDVIREDDIRLRDYADYVYRSNPNFVNWIRRVIVRLTVPSHSTKIKKGVIKYQRVQDFFKQMHDDVKKLNIDENSIKFYEDAMANAASNGQTALLQLLAKKKDVLLKELQLLENGQTKYVSEEDIVKFFKKSEEFTDKFLNMTWIKNYVRIIPQEVLDVKKKCDEHYLFDNYAILHFDKTGDSSEMTDEDKERAKDPILFGLIKGSRKLYFIGDWEDEYCDLTLDNMLLTLEKEHADELSKESIEKEILK